MFMSIGGVTIPVRYRDGAHQEPPIEVGDRGRAFSGDSLTSIRGWRRPWTVVTKPITRAVADTIIAELKSAPPRSLNGDIVNNVAVSVVVQLQGEEYVPTALGLMVVLKFRLEEV